MKNCILTSRDQQQRVKQLGIKKECSDFFHLLNILPKYVEKDNIEYNFCLNRRRFGESLSYSNKYSNCFIVYIENDDWNEGCIQMIELLTKFGYNLK